MTRHPAKRFNRWPLPANVKTWRRWGLALGLALLLAAAVLLSYLPVFIAKLPVHEFDA
jgi:hypothetical protein